MMWPMPDDGFSWAGRRFSPTDSPDVRLAFRVAERLQADERSRHVAVEVQNRVVLLTGSVDSRATKDLLAGVVRSIEGVTDVCNGLRVDGDDVPDRFASIVADLAEPDPARDLLPSGLALAGWLCAMAVLWAGLSVLLVRLF
jgi:hypothetical protein